MKNSMEANNVLEVKNLTKKFKKVTAVDNISFNLKEGEILGILGSNGAGKTTIIQMLLGILTPTAGEIKYFNKNFKYHREEILENINFSSTYINLPLSLTVKEGLNFISYLYKIENRKERIAKIVDIFKLKRHFKVKINDLSSGQLTRLNLAKAFINYPKVLLLDEPTSSLDPEAAEYIRDFLLEEKEKFGVSIIITSHNMAEVEKICDRVIFIDKGKILADDSPLNLARSTELCHVELLINDGFEKLIEFLKEKSYSHKIKGKYLLIDLNEKEIEKFLSTIKKKKIGYDEITVNRATLEDYFLKNSSFKRI